MQIMLQKVYKKKADHK